MRTPSRRMPASTRHELSWPAASLALLALVVVLASFTWPAVSLLLGWTAGSIFTCLAVMAFALLSAREESRRRRRLGDMAAGRPDESICTFVRSFARRAVDTWVLRAVYEELQPYGRAGGVTLPLRASDGLDEVLGIDPEELDEIVCDIAHRARRSLKAYELNPFFGRLTTVGDLVWFFQNQARYGASPDFAP